MLAVVVYFTSIFNQFSVCSIEKKTVINTKKQADARHLQSRLLLFEEEEKEENRFVQWYRFSIFTRIVGA